MKKLRIAGMVLAAVISCSALKAQQGELRMTASIAAGMPMGQLKDLTSKTSLRGFDASLLYGINDKISVGLQLGFQDFYEKFPRDLYKLEDGSEISAVISNSIQSIPLLAAFRYNFSPTATVQPYAAMGLGGNILLNRQFIGEYPNAENKFGFAARPELGIYIPFRKEGYTGVNLGVNYNYNSYNKSGINDLSYIGIKLGIAFPLRD